MHRCCACALALALLSCRHDPWEEGGVAGTAKAKPPPVASVDSGTPLSVSTDIGPPASDADGGSPIDAVFFTAKPLRGKSIGHTSIVFKLSLEGAHDTAYKPRSKIGGERFRGEIAAYRLARAWGLTNVPPAVFRAFPAGELKNSLDDNASGIFSDQVVVEGDGNVRGAEIPWISHLEFLPLEKPDWRAKWTGWLEGADAGALSQCDRDMASQISTMIAFDVLIGNWDRWSGGNIGDGGVGGCTQILYIDNDGAFFDPVPQTFLDKQIAELHKLRRFSKSFAIALRSTSEDALRIAIGEESPGRPLLPDRVVVAFFARRKLVLDAIDGATKAWGESAVLSLP